MTFCTPCSKRRISIRTFITQLHQILTLKLKLGSCCRLRRELLRDASGSEHLKIYRKREPNEPLPFCRHLSMPVTIPASVPLKAKPDNVRLAEPQAPPLGLLRGSLP